ncbi:alpha/beta hydrolase, partial [Streptomyces klenkii]|uniref:alpha/beta fold hydrolase n=1 Tax=Streptomyces klenkii TaxID=1420899 RepID=UPI0033B5FBC3
MDGKTRIHNFGGIRFGSTTWPCPRAQLSPIVLVCGAAETTASRRTQANALAAHATVVAIDLLGAEWGSMLPATAGPDFAADAIQSVIDQLDLGPVNLFGLCAGAYGAYALARRHPASVLRAALGAMMVTPSPDVTALRDRSVDMICSGRTVEWADLMTAQLMCLDPGRDVQSRELLHQSIKQRVLDAEPEELRRHIAFLASLAESDALYPTEGVQQPALFFTGEHDTLCPLEETRALAELCADARLFS